MNGQVKAASYLGERYAEEMLSECRKYGCSYKVIGLIHAIPAHHECLLEEWFGTSTTPSVVEAYVLAFRTRVEGAYAFDPLLYPGAPGM